MSVFSKKNADFFIACEAFTNWLKEFSYGVIIIYAFMFIFLKAVRRDKMEIEAIQSLIETDENVRNQIQDIYNQRALLKKAIEDEKKKMSEETWKEVNETVAKTKAELDKKIQDDDVLNQAYYAKASKQLQDMFDQNKDSWCKEVYNRIVKGE